jgi:hypothetical protein
MPSWRQRKILSGDAALSWQIPMVIESSFYSHETIAEPDAGPNDEERGHVLLPIGAFSARSSSSVSFPFGDNIIPS